MLVENIVKAIPSQVLSSPSPTNFKPASQPHAKVAFSSSWHCRGNGQASPAFSHSSKAGKIVLKNTLVTRRYLLFKPSPIPSELSQDAWDHVKLSRNGVYYSGATALS